MVKEEFKSLEEKCDRLWRENNLKEALDIMDQAYDEYKEEIETINLYRAMLNFNLDNIDKGVEILKDSLDRGIWYPALYFKNMKDKEELKGIFEAWEKLREEAQSKAKMELTIKEPKNYDKAKNYPLFIALHGWGEDAAMFSNYWVSNKIEEEYILVIPQSSQVLSSVAFSWNDPSIAHKDIKRAYETVLGNYNIDRDRIIIGGFSQGAMRTLDIVLNENYIQPKGFIALCPDKPEQFERENIKKVSLSGIKGVILTGDKDSCYEEQKEIMGIFKEEGLMCEIKVKENFGHWFPEDLEQRIDSALEYILR